MLKRKVEGDASSPINLGSPEPGPSDFKKPKTEGTAETKPAVEFDPADVQNGTALKQIIIKHGTHCNKDTYRKAFRQWKGYELPLTNGVIDYIMQDTQFRYVYRTELWNYTPKSNVLEIHDILAHIRTHSAVTGGVPVRMIKQHDADYLNTLQSWEDAGKILIMRVPGKVALPQLGMPAAQQVKFKGETGELEMMTRENKGKYWRSVYWDGWRERGAVGGKLEPEFTEMWAKVETPPDADVVKMLNQLGHNIQPSLAPARKLNTSAGAKKKKASKRNVKTLTNDHLKAQGIDLSQDYTPEP